MGLSLEEIKLAESIRKETIFMERQFVNMCHTPIAENARYTIKAYEMMTNEQILMSKKMDYEARSKESGQLLEDYQRDQDDIRNRVPTEDDPRAGRLCGVVRDCCPIPIVLN